MLSRPVQSAQFMLDVLDQGKNVLHRDGSACGEQDISLPLRNGEARAAARGGGDVSNASQKP